MTFQTGHIPSNRGKYSAVDPIKDADDIQAIKQLLRNRPRELAIFTVAINLALRASDLLAMRRSDICHLANGRLKFQVIERKTGKPKLIFLNEEASSVLTRYMDLTPTAEYLFEGQRGPLTVRSVGAMIKEWTREVGMQGRFASHTARKTFCRQHLDKGAKITTLMYALNHSSEAQTLQYVGLVQEDVQALYDQAL